MEQDTNASIRTMSIINFLVGIWLIISPYILGYVTAQAMWEQTVAGVIVVILTAVRMMSPRQVWTSWVNAIIGAWLIIAPYVTGYQATSAFWNEVIFGIILAVVALSNAATRSTSQTHHRRHTTAS